MITNKIAVAIIVLVILGGARNLVLGQDTAFNSTDESELIYFQSSSLFKCNIKLPAKYDQEKAHTLVIGLHGGGATPESFVKIWDKVEGVNFIYVAPQGPYPILFDELGNEWSLWSSPDLKIRERAGELIVIYISDLVEVLRKQFIIDDIYISGFSQGAVYTYMCCLMNPKLFTGMLIFSGPGIFEPLGNFDGKFAPDWIKEKYLKTESNLRVFISHGVDDQAVNYKLGVKSNEILNSYGYDVTFHSFEGGHAIDTTSLHKALQWINKEE